MKNLKKIVAIIMALALVFAFAGCGKQEAKVIKTAKGKKVVVYKMKPKKGYRRKQGHRQPYTKIQIEKISM